ncbi:MAG TPA: peptidoglycan-binding protein [Stenomitos sp.]
MDPRNLAAAPYAPPMGAPQYQQLLGALHQMQSAPSVPSAPAAPPRDSLTLSQGSAAVNPALTPYLQDGTMSRLTELLHQLMTGRAPATQTPATSAEPWNNPNYPKPSAPTAPPVPPAPPAQTQPAPATDKPVPTPTPPAPKEPESRTYTVRPGDSLSVIAKRELGNASRWREIFDLNQDQIKDPNRIFPGQTLKLPKSDAPHKPDHPDPKPAEPTGSGPILKQGAKGDPVRRLQERLKELGFDPGSVDGDLGPKTVAAIKRFQEQKGLTADGVVGPKTWDQLGIDVKGEVQYPSAPSGGSSDRPINIGGPQPAVSRQGKYIGARIADQFDSMVAAAAKDGVRLVINSGYRSHAEQEALWRANPDPRYVARPGTSNHEQGNAIDFANTPGAWAWLKRNATRFGFHNYPPEAWHYSLDGR